MAAASGTAQQPAASLTKILESICRERRRENLDKVSEDGFVVLAIESFWTRLFSQYFIENHDESRDDLLFFVKSKNAPKALKVETERDCRIAVYRRDAKNLPSLGDPDIDWEETVYLNLIIQQFDYTLTCAVCTKPSGKELKVLKRVSQRLYASPSRRRMDSKGETTEVSYPNIFFIIDNFEELFQDFTLHQSQMVCVELVARDKAETMQGVIFLGSIRYESLLKVYEKRAGVASRMAQKVSLGWFTGHSGVEFIKMKGPNSKGHAEMAISREKCVDDELNGHVLESHPSTSGFPLSRRNRGGSNEGKLSRSFNERTYHGIPDDEDDIDADCVACAQNQCTEKHFSLNRKGSFKGLGAPVQWLKTRRSNSVVLTAYLTYVTLPWNRIMKDILEVRQQPILT